MKKWISLLCVCMLIMGMVMASVVAASAEDKGENAVDVKKGDEVTYVLKLDKVEEPIVGSDFSVYYDSSVFTLESVGDFNDKTDPDDWTAVINPKLDGEVRGVWSILKGVDFSSQRNFVTLNLKAKEDASNTHLTYRIRFLYGNSAFDENKPYVTPYKFTADVSVNGDKVLDDVSPEWDDKHPAENGKFVPSYDGDSENADSDISGVEDKSNQKKSGSGNSQGKSGNANGGSNGGSMVGGSGAGGSMVGGSNTGGSNTGGSGTGGSGGGSNSGNANGGGSNNSGNASNANNGAAANSNNDSGAEAAPLATTAEGYYILATDAEGNVVATSDEAPEMATANSDNAKGGPSPVLWIIIALVVLAGGGAAVYFFMKKKPSANAAAPVNEANTENVPASDEQITSEPVDDAKTELADEDNTQSVDEAKTVVADEDEKTQAADDSSDSDNQ